MPLAIQLPLQPAVVEQFVRAFFDHARERRGHPVAQFGRPFLPVLGQTVVQNAIQAMFGQPVVLLAKTSQLQRARAALVPFFVQEPSKGTAKRPSFERSHAPPVHRGAGRNLVEQALIGRRHSSPSPGHDKVLAFVETQVHRIDGESGARRIRARLPAADFVNRKQLHHRQLGRARPGAQARQIRNLAHAPTGLRAHGKEWDEHPSSSRTRSAAVCRFRLHRVLVISYRVYDGESCRP